uniref:Bactericidal permeability-increasing protein n=1 Tax=Periophthalmus magnuspinnatus TaxID=409849 RepID=A0A3B4ANV0_9GOBI
MVFSSCATFWIRLSWSMLLHAWLLLVALTTLTSGLNPGVKVKLTQKGLEYGRELGIASIQQKLKTIKLPDVTLFGTFINTTVFFLSMHIINVGLPQSAVSLVPGAGIKLSIGNAYLSLNGNWRVKYLKFIKDSGSFDLSVSGLSITTTVAVNSDETGRPTVTGNNCVNSQSDNSVLLLSSWLYNLFKDFIAKALRSALEKQVKQLQLSVLQETSGYAEIQYSLVSSPVISTTSHQEPPFIPNVFSMPPESNNMLYLGLSSYTANSAGFVYTTAGAIARSFIKKGLVTVAGSDAPLLCCRITC